MSAARIIYTPLSGRDRLHFSRELQRVEQELNRLTAEAEAAHAAADRQLAEAHRLDCLAYNARLFVGGPDEPSPTIAQALHGNVPLLEVQCRTCNHAQMIDLADAVWPRTRPIHTLAAKMFCQRCQKDYGRKRRPALTALLMRDEPKPSAPAAAKQQRD